MTTFVLACVSFAGGFCVNYASRYAQVDQAIVNIAALSIDFKAFLKEYNASHETTAVAIRELNQHLEYTDRRVADLEKSR